MMTEGDHVDRLGASALSVESTLVKSKVPLRNKVPTSIPVTPD